MQVRSISPQHKESAVKTPVVLADLSGRSRVLGEEHPAVGFGGLSAGGQTSVCAGAAW